MDDDQSHKVLASSASALTIRLTSRMDVIDVGLEELGHYVSVRPRIAGFYSLGIGIPWMLAVFFKSPLMLLAGPIVGGILTTIGSPLYLNKVVYDLGLDARHRGLLEAAYQLARKNIERRFGKGTETPSLIAPEMHRLLRQAGFIAPESWGSGE